MVPEIFAQIVGEISNVNFLPSVYHEISDARHANIDGLQLSLRELLGLPLLPVSTLQNEPADCEYYL